jgi:hypothetical protein
MIKITETTKNDLEQIQEWVDADPWHKHDDNNDPEYMLTGYGVLAFCLQDAKGPLAYIKLTEDGDDMRISMQFAPESVVSKKRLVLGLIKVGIPLMKGYAEGWGSKGLVFESVNPSLIGFALNDKVGFKNVEGTNDFRFNIEEQRDV